MKCYMAISYHHDNLTKRSSLKILGLFLTKEAALDIARAYVEEYAREYSNYYQLTLFQVIIFKDNGYEVSFSETDERLMARCYELELDSSLDDVWIY